MSFIGEIKNGTVVFDAEIGLPDGTVVQVILRDGETSATENTHELSHYDRYKDIIGAATGLPEDFAGNHDHYIHGAPK